MPHGWTQQAPDPPSFRWKLARGHARPDVGPSDGTSSTFSLSLVAGLTLLIAITSFVSNGMLLAAMSFISLAAAGLLGVVAYRKRIRRESKHITMWDVAGGLALFGFVAGTLCGPEHVLQIFELAQTSR
ncbi:MAG: hypothetical protein FJX35_14835 [Alphaproteobacteria bacterium]|nr:hypothetical protein [Alphaproteobacteria bacterium]